MAHLQCEGLTKAFGDLVAVDGVGFEVSEGETYGLLGPNGAGKTTTISMIVGLLRPDDGTIQLNGDAMHPGARDVKARVGYVPQEIALYPDLTGRENLAFFARLHGLPDADNRIGHVLEVTGLAARADDRAGEYSGGMQRRLNIGIALLHRPQLLVLDEPTVGVDPQSRDAILAAVEELAGGGVSVLYTTHYMEEAERLCDRVGIIDHGELVAEGTRRELVAMVGQQDRVTLAVDGDAAAVAAVLRDRSEVSTATSSGQTVELHVDEAGQRLPNLLAAATSDGATVTGVEVAEPDLESVFLHVTGRALRDA